MIRINPFPSHATPHGPSLTWQTGIWGRSGEGGTLYSSSWECADAKSIEDAEGAMICGVSGGIVPKSRQANTSQGIVFDRLARRDPEWEEWNKR